MVTQHLGAALHDGEGSPGPDALDVLGDAPKGRLHPGRHLHHPRHQLLRQASGLEAQGPLMSRPGFPLSVLQTTANNCFPDVLSNVNVFPQNSK